MTNEEVRTALETACASSDFPGTLSFRPTFGGILAYVGPRDFASISSVGLAFKLSSAQGRDLLKAGGKMVQHDENSPASKTAVVVPEDMLADLERLRTWATRSAIYAKSLPPALRKRTVR